MWDWISDAVGGLAGLFGGGNGVVVPDGGFGLDYSPAALDFIPGGATNYVGDLPLNDYNYVGDLPLADEPTVTLGDGFSSMDRQQYQPTTWGNLYNGVTGTDGSVIGANPSLAGMGNLASALSGKSVLDNLARAGGSGGSGGGSTTNFSMPVIPPVERITALPSPAVPVPPVQTGALPTTPPPPSEFKPMMLQTPERPEMGGLARVFADALRREGR